MSEPRERLWPRRLRWKLRGAWLWPVFAFFAAVDGLVLNRLPISGEGTGIVPGAILAAFLNLAAVALLAPVLGRAVRRRRPDLPRLIANDYAGTALIVLIAIGLLGAGLVHRPAVIDAREDFTAQSRAVRGYVLAQAGPVYHRNLAAADTWKVEDELFRTCVPGADPDRSLCLFVRTSQSPPGVTVDDDRAPNSRYIGPEAIGHR